MVLIGLIYVMWRTHYAHSIVDFWQSKVNYHQHIQLSETTRKKLLIETEEEED